MKTDLSLNNAFSGLSLQRFKHKPNSASGGRLGLKPNENDNGRVYFNELENNSKFNRPTESASFSGSAVLKGNKKTSEKRKGNGLLAAAAVTVATTGALLALSGKRKPNAQGEIPEWATKIAASPKFNAALDFAERNESKLSALLSLGLAGILKPFVVLCMPGAKKEDKEVTATKNSLSAFIGYGLSCAILDPISSGVNEFIKTPEKYLGPENELVKEFAKNKAEEFVIHSKEELKQMKYKSNTLNAFKSCYKKGLGIIVAPLKAALTIAIMPYVLKAIFGDKMKKKNAPEETSPNLAPFNYPQLMAHSNGNNLFKNAFDAPIQTNTNLNNYNAPAQNKFENSFPKNAPSFKGNKKQNLSFKGKEGIFTKTLNNTFKLDEKIARGTAWLSQTKFSEAVVNTTRKFKNPTARLSDLESFAITYFYVQNTAKSKKIKKERKLPSIIQNIAVTIVSSTAAALIDKAFDPIIDLLTLGYQKLPNKTVQNLGGKSAKQFYDAARKLKSNTVFTLVVRFIVPVMMVPVVGSIVKRINGKMGNREEAEAKKEKPKAPAPAFQTNALAEQTAALFNKQPQVQEAVQKLSGLSQVNSHMYKLAQSLDTLNNTSGANK